MRPTTNNPRTTQTGDSVHQNCEFLGTFVLLIVVAHVCVDSKFHSELRKMNESMESALKYTLYSSAVGALLNSWDHAIIANVFRGSNVCACVCACLQYYIMYIMMACVVNTRILVPFPRFA